MRHVFSIPLRLKEISWNSSQTLSHGLHRCSSSLLRVAERTGRQKLGAIRDTKLFRQARHFRRNHAVCPASLGFAYDVAFLPLRSLDLVGAGEETRVEKK